MSYFTSTDLCSVLCVVAGMLWQQHSALMQLAKKFDPYPLTLRIVNELNLIAHLPLPFRGA